MNEPSFNERKARDLVNWFGAMIAVGKRNSERAGRPWRYELEK